MAAVVGWYGPLIDLARASLYVDEFVQLLVFVHHSQPIQKANTANGGSLLKTRIQVGDGTRTYFSVSIWPTHIRAVVASGDIILLQNVKIVRFRDILESTSLPASSLLVLVQSHELLASKDGKLERFIANSHSENLVRVEGLLLNSKLGKTAKVKLRRVLEWVHHTESAFQNIQQEGFVQTQKRLKNWKEDGKLNLISCSSISEIVELKKSCNANFCALTAEVIYPLTWRSVEVEMEKLLFCKSLVKMSDYKVLEDLIGTGCKLCGSPMATRAKKESKTPLYCQKSSNYIHDVCVIYKPFMLHVWDETGQITILVKNKAAEILFGMITAEDVYRSYQVENPNHSAFQHIPPDGLAYPSLEHLKRNDGKKKLNFYRIWLILIKLLLQQGQNSPFQFQITVDLERDLETGRYELVSIKMPCKKLAGTGDISA